MVVRLSMLLAAVTVPLNKAAIKSSRGSDCRLGPSCQHHLEYMEVHSLVFFEGRLHTKQTDIIVTTHPQLIYFDVIPSHVLLINVYSLAIANHSVNVLYYYTCSSLKELFDNVDATTIFSWILSKKSIFIILFNDLCYGFPFYSGSTTTSSAICADLASWRRM